MGICAGAIILLPACGAASAASRRARAPILAMEQADGLIRVLLNFPNRSLSPVLYSAAIFTWSRRSSGTSNGRQILCCLSSSGPTFQFTTTLASFQPSPGPGPRSSV